MTNACITSPRDSHAFIDVKDLIDKYTVEELCESAEEYYCRCSENVQVLAKPFGLAHVRHLLPEFAYLLAGLDLRPYMTVLDFGCGTGWTSRMLNQMSLEVISLDVSRTALELGKRLKQLHPVIGDQPAHRFLQFDGRRIDLPDQSVDRILCLDAFHHVPNQQEVLSEMGRVLREGGIAGFSEPGPHHSTSPQAQTEMKLHRVIENDIVLEEILSKAQTAGFTEMRVAIGSPFPLVVSLSESHQFRRNEALVDTYLSMTADRSQNYPQFFLHKGHQKIADSRDACDLIARIRSLEAGPLRATSGQEIQIALEVLNNSTKTWLPSGDKIGAVNLGGALFECANYSRLAEHRWHLSSVQTGPGGIIRANIALPGLEPGTYRLEIDVVSEHVCWFAWNGSRPITVDIVVA